MCFLDNCHSFYITFIRITKIKQEQAIIKVKWQRIITPKSNKKQLKTENEPSVRNSVYERSKDMRCV